jgi:hypothetical protein
MFLVEARVHAAGEAPTPSKIFIFKHSKMQCTCFYVVICLMYVQASHLLHLTKSRLCVVLFKHPECTVPHHISCPLQFDLNAHKTESKLYLSNGASVCSG